ncbi:hypothetical protein VT85_13120 [Planctomyces sp. SH-PL62]|nr:hypothetical protein VT85_13120 [Planctomyces sp. SH-PL62]
MRKSRFSESQIVAVIKPVGWPSAKSAAITATLENTF